MDVLDDILGTLDLKGALYFRTDFSPPWGITVPPLEQAARFHLVVHGQCWVRFANGQSLSLSAGDIVLIPRGASHIISDAPDRDAPDLETTLSLAGYKGDGVLVLGQAKESATTQLVCGHFTFRKQADHPLLRALPDHILTTNATRARNPWLDEALRLVAQRVFSDAQGSGATVTRLSEIVFIELIRSAVSENGPLQTVVAAFGDRQIGNALLNIHKWPERNWTVGNLAAEVGMSRSRFAERFQELVGIAPMTYLADWRLQKALALLDTSQSSVQQVASQIGYLSPAAFSRAFSSKFGYSPSDYRRSLH